LPLRVQFGSGIEMNIYEMLAREKKVGAMTCALLEVGCTAQQAEDRADDEPFWRLVAKAANVKPPSAESVKELIAQMKRLENARSKAR
jgi:hypothetical protein